MELETRWVFIDTSAYENKNYQFGQHILESLHELIELGQIRLLITSVTKNEIESHLKIKAKEATAAIKKITKDAMFLRNVPELNCHGIFTKVNEDEIYDIVHKKFLTLISDPSVKTLNVNSVNPEVVFNAYFNELPPFNKGSKKNEFPDAFVLEAIKNFSIKTSSPIYIVSSDGDMKSFCDNEEKLILLESIDALVDLIVREDKAYAEPAKFADEIFDQLHDKIKDRALSLLENESEYYYATSIDGNDHEIVDVSIKSIDIKKKSIQSVETDQAKYSIEFEATITVDSISPDFDRSPWDPENKSYVFLLYNKYTTEHKEIYSANLTLIYDHGLKKNAQIEELYFEEPLLELTSENMKLISFEEKDWQS